MTNREIKNRLSSLAALKASGEPNALWVTETRASLMSKISATAPAPTTASQEIIKLPRIGFWSNFMVAMRPVMVIVMLFGFGAFGYFSSMGAIASALPGNALYGFKTITERAQLTFAASDDARALLHAEFAGERASEVAALAEAGSGASEQNVTQAVSNLADEMKTVSATMQAVKSDYGTGAVAIAKTVDRKAAEVRAILGKTKSMLSPASQTQVQSVEDMADNISIQAVAVLASSPSDAKSADVKQRVQDNIDSATQKLEIASPDSPNNERTAKAAKDALRAAQKAADSADYVEAISEVQQAVSLTAGTDAAAGATGTSPAAAAGTAVNANANANTNVNAPATNTNGNVNENTNVNAPVKIKAIDQ